MGKRERPYKGPRSARDPRLHQPTWGAGAEHGRSWTLGRNSKLALGGLALGGGATIVYRNRKVKKMAGRGGAGLPDRVMGFSTPHLGRTRETSPIVGRKKAGQLPFTEKYTFPGASPRRLGVTRATGTKGDRRGKLVQVKKNADLPFKGSKGTGAKVVRLQARTPKGKYVGTANDLQVFHPKFKSTSRMPRTSKLQHYKKGRDQYASAWEGGKSLFGGGVETTFALSGTANLAAFASQQGRRGKRF